MSRTITLCQGHLQSDPREEVPATTRSVNPDWSGYDLCDECAAEYDARPLTRARAEYDADQLAAYDAAQSDRA
jgi:hypothetical protein